MPIYVNTVPQDVTPIRILTIKELINALPETLDYSINVWLTDKIARYGKTTDNLIFLSDGVTEYPSSEMMSYFDSLVSPMGFQATLSNDWKCNNTIANFKIYNDGRLIIDKETMTYKELPSTIVESYSISFQDVVSKLPSSIEWNHTIYLTGGIVKNGFSNNDVDFIVFDEIDNETFVLMKKYFYGIMGCKTHIGKYVMVDREPVYLYKIYENGIKLWQ